MKKLKEIWRYAPVLNKVSYWVCLILAAVLLIAGFLLPPIGIIDNSVLLASGEIFFFAALGTAIAAIDRGMDAKLAKGDASLELKNPDNLNSNID